MSAVPRWRVYLRLGRVSNLPTVWTNAVAGAVLSGARPAATDVLMVAVSMSLFYTGGMFLNDAFDRDHDAARRPDRPIPAGLISSREVFGVGYAMLAAGEALLLPRGTLAMAMGLLLAAVIVAYDRWHKDNPFGPLLMGLCRALVYVTAAAAVGGAMAVPVAGGAVALFCYIVGLTYAAKQEDRSGARGLWPLAILSVPLLYGIPQENTGVVGVALLAALVTVVAYAIRILHTEPRARIPHAVALLIAGVSLLDALLIVGHSGPVIALTAALGFPVTLAAQRLVRGT